MGRTILLNEKRYMSTFFQLFPANVVFVSPPPYRSETFLSIYISATLLDGSPTSPLLSVLPTIQVFHTDKWKHSSLSGPTEIRLTGRFVNISKTANAGNAWRVTMTLSRSIWTSYQHSLLINLVGHVTHFLRFRSYPRTNLHFQQT